MNLGRRNISKILIYSQQCIFEQHIHVSLHQLLDVQILLLSSINQFKHGQFQIRRLLYLPCTNHRRGISIHTLLFIWTIQSMHTAFQCVLGLALHLQQSVWVLDRHQKMCMAKLTLPLITRWLNLLVYVESLYKHYIIVMNIAWMKIRNELSYLLKFIKYYSTKNILRITTRIGNCNTYIIYQWWYMSQVLVYFLVMIVICGSSF
ncbi:unnamed protein product (macronuclear) [Paramecium tetraurelia]|uniref:Uncharacterized protein n=1 Tax=Paramecium tetraurelia TaxID=5888 RepID=A0EGB8_PARTE|nr:uncharacterized protein GSPATT00026683001 [Paramecium tetraurelia]CAK94359.1 unnamed protein product [Paramecium tetraurelia]|eukprot:XP_001461732.1 hypothetical protein (macronuclear) [Paramecium tetraurelia strain d4-2]